MNQDELSVRMSSDVNVQFSWVQLQNRTVHLAELNWSAEFGDMTSPARTVDTGPFIWPAQFSRDDVNGPLADDAPPTGRVNRQTDTQTYRQTDRCSIRKPYITWLIRFQIKPHIGWSDVTVTCGHITISILWSNTAYCVKLYGEDLWRYSNKIESVGLRKFPYYHCHRAG